MVVSQYGAMEFVRGKTNMKSLELYDRKESLTPETNQTKAVFKVKLIF